jgi:hypothetical protein
MRQILISAAIIAAAACGAATVDYAEQSEEIQQQRLDRFASGFKAGFNATSRGQAEIERMTANAAWDSVTADIRFKPANVEQASLEDLAAFRKYLFDKSCNFAPQRSLFEQGVSLKLRLKKPSGSTLANYELNQKNCTPHYK